MQIGQMCTSLHVFSKNERACTVNLISIASRGFFRNSIIVAIPFAVGAIWKIGPLGGILGWFIGLAISATLSAAFVVASSVGKYALLGDHAKMARIQLAVAVLISCAFMLIYGIAFFSGKETLNRQISALDDYNSLRKDGRCFSAALDSSSRFRSPTKEDHEVFASIQGESFSSGEWFINIQNPIIGLFVVWDSMECGGCRIPRKQILYNFSNNQRIKSSVISNVKCP